jgi:hypothetical protein
MRHNIGHSSVYLSLKRKKRKKKKKEKEKNSFTVLTFKLILLRKKVPNV